jgi:hypothetical protein
MVGYYQKFIHMFVVKARPLTRSGKVVGNTLSQLDENGHDHPIHFPSGQLISTEKNYTVIK